MAAGLMGGVADYPLEKAVDREKSCPLLLRVFLNPGRHHPAGEFARGKVPPNELQIYTWQDASLKELANLVKEVREDSRRRGTTFDFALVYPDASAPVYRMREIGTTVNGQKGPDDTKTLASVSFQVGDYLDIAIYPPGQQPPNRQGPGVGNENRGGFNRRGGGNRF